MEAIYIIAAVVLTYAAYRAFRGGLRDLHGSKIPRGLVKMALTAGLFAGALEVGSLVTSYEFVAVFSGDQLYFYVLVPASIALICLFAAKALGFKPLANGTKFGSAFNVSMAVIFIVMVLNTVALAKIISLAVLMTGFVLVLSYFRKSVPPDHDSASADEYEKILKHDMVYDPLYSDFGINIHNKDGLDKHID